MLIDCPACARSYHVSSAAIGEGGRAVICPRCDAQWFVHSDGRSTTGSPSQDLRISSFSQRPTVAAWDASPADLRHPVWRRAAPALIAATLLMSAMAALGARERVVRAAPRLAALYEKLGLPVNVRGLQIENLSSDRLDASSLTVAGAIRNVARRRVVVPRLVYQVRDSEGTPIATWTEKLAVRTLGTGKSTAFVSAPHQLPAEGRTVLVRFQADEDLGPAMLLARRGD